MRGSSASVSYWSKRLQPVHVLERVFLVERRVRITGHVLVHAGIDVHPAERFEIRFGVQGVAAAQSGSHPAAAQVKDLALDAEMGPKRCRPCRPARSSPPRPRNRSTATARSGQ